MSSLSICRMVEGCYPRQNAIPEDREVIFPIGDCAPGGQSSRMVVREGCRVTEPTPTVGYSRKARRGISNVGAVGALCSIRNMIVSRDPGLNEFIVLNLLLIGASILLF